LSDGVNSRLFQRAENKIDQVFSFGQSMNQYEHDMRVEKRNINDLHTRVNDNIRGDKIIASSSLENEHACVDESAASAR
jgi:hypothetical protein